MRLKITAFLLLGLASVGCQPNVGLEVQSERWYVSEVLDGESLVVEREGNKDLIRLCGVDAPDKNQPLGVEATVKLEELVEDRYVAIVPIERLPDGMMVAEVFIVPPERMEERERFVQKELLLSGSVRVYVPYVDSCINGRTLKMAEAIAQEKQVGVWADAGRMPH